jgi:hypothetical protein
MKTSGILAALFTLIPLITALPTGSSFAEAGVSVAIQLHHSNPGLTLTLSTGEHFRTPGRFRMH